jgi:hypothetical protein
MENQGIGSRKRIISAANRLPWNANNAGVTSQSTGLQPISNPIPLQAPA